MNEGFYRMIDAAILKLSATLQDTIYLPFNLQVMCEMWDD